VTPDQRHHGRERAVLASRHDLYERTAHNLDLTDNPGRTREEHRELSNGASHSDERSAELCFDVSDSEDSIAAVIRA
jgi:hypothetical protein